MKTKFLVVPIEDLKSWSEYIFKASSRRLHVVELDPETLTSTHAVPEEIVNRPTR